MSKNRGHDRYFSLQDDDAYIRRRKPLIIFFLGLYGGMGQNPGILPDLSYIAKRQRNHKWELPYFCGDSVVGWKKLTNGDMVGFSRARRGCVSQEETPYFFLLSVCSGMNIEKNTYHSEKMPIFCFLELWLVYSYCFFFSVGLCLIFFIFLSFVW